MLALEREGRALRIMLIVSAGSARLDDRGQLTLKPGEQFKHRGPLRRQQLRRVLEFSHAADRPALRGCAYSDSVTCGVPGPGMTLVIVTGAVSAGCWYPTSSCSLRSRPSSS